MRLVGLIRMDLVLDAPGGVTAPEIDAVADLPLRRAPDGQVWIPPSSLAGSLRAHFGTRAEEFFGSEPPAGRGTSVPLRPSPVRFLGTRTALPADQKTQKRASTAVDPVRAAAVAATLRTRELLPTGTMITLYLRYDDRRDLRGDDRREPRGGQAPLPLPPYAPEEFVELAASWRPRIGRGRSCGHGTASLRRVAYRSLDLNQAADLKAWLAAGRDELFPDEDESWQYVRSPARAHDSPVLRLDFVTVDALHIGAGSTTGPASVLTSGGPPIIPASTWKGLLRARCGYILRSCGQPACLVPHRCGQPCSHLVEGSPEPACRTCRLCFLFGWSGDSGQPGQPVGRLGALTFHDSEIDGVAGHRHHIGIDRFTGGVRPQLLFTDEVITDGRFTLRITMTRPGDIDLADRGLLLLAIRDLNDGLIGIGKSTTRGYGTVRLADGGHSIRAELAPGHDTGAAVLMLLRGAA